MKNETNFLFGLLLLMTAMMLFASIILNNNNKKLRRELDSLQIKYDTTKVDTFTKRDTLYVDSTITDRHPTKVIWMYQKNESTNKVEAVPIPNKLNVWEGEIGNDSAKIGYKAYLCPPQAKLDSIDINYKIRLINQAQTINKEVVKTITIDKAKKKHWYNRFHISVQAGYGYGFKYKGIEPYVGLGGSFDL